MGLAVARLTALRDLMRAQVGTLNAAIAANGVTGIATITTANVVIGDPKVLPSATDAPVLICVKAGGPSDNVERTTEQIATREANKGGIKHAIGTNLLVYISPDTLPAPGQTSAGHLAFAEQRELLLSTLIDWLSGIFDVRSGALIALSSNEFANPGGGDYLKNGLLTDIYISETNKGFGDKFDVACIHARHIAHT